MNSTVLLLVAGLMAAPLTVLAGMVRLRLVRTAAVVTTGLAFAAALYAAFEPGTEVDRAWAPTWGPRLHFDADGLAVLYALLATGIGLAVVVFSIRYLPQHLRHEHRAEHDEVRFYGFLLLFMGAMTGLVLAQDLMLIFLFWDLTAIASYYLIGYDQHRRDARTAAFTALMVTGISAVGFLIGALVLNGEYGTFQLPELIAVAESNRQLTVAATLIAIAALAKSAQVPLHFWLPRAMAAPTPVSAYLHSAAMVAAGVFLIGRFYPLLALSASLLDALVVVGVLSMAVGGLLALTRDNMKQLLAYSTIAQYGYVVTMFGLGGEAGVVGAMFFVLAHAVAKSALFLTAGAVTEATGARELSATGGLRKDLPWLALASGLAAAALAGLPVTIGFFKDELFFHAAAEHGSVTKVVSVLAASMTLGYAARFWFGLFGGKPKGAAQPVSPLLTAPIALLGAIALLGGLWPEPFARIAANAASVSLQTPIEIDLAYHFTWSPESAMALASIAIGTTVFLTSRYWGHALHIVAEIGERIGPDKGFGIAILKLNAFSDRIHWIEVRDLRSRVATVLLPAAILVGIALIFSDVDNVFQRGSVNRDDLPLVMLFVVVGLAALAAAVPRDHFSMALALSGVGFGLSVVFALLRAPDVALVAVLVETLFGLLFFAFLALLPRDVDHAEVVPSDEPLEAGHVHRIRDSVLALVAGGFAFVIAWGVLSRPAPVDSIINQHIALTPEAHGEAIVTVILADFRGLDTMGEITVIGIAFLGIATFLRRRVAR